MLTITISAAVAVLETTHRHSGGVPSNSSITTSWRRHAPRTAGKIE